MYWQVYFSALEFWQSCIRSDNCLTRCRHSLKLFRLTSCQKQAALSYTEVCISLGLSVTLLLATYQGLALLSLQYHRWRGYVLQVLHGQQAIGYLRQALGQSQVASCKPLSEILQRKIPGMSAQGRRLLVTHLRAPRYLKSQQGHTLRCFSSGNLPSGTSILISDCLNGEVAHVARAMPRTGVLHLSQALRHQYATRSLVAAVSFGEWFVRHPKQGLSCLAYKPEHGPPVDVVPGIANLQLLQIGSCWQLSLESLAQYRPAMKWRQWICTV